MEVRRFVVVGALCAVACRDGGKGDPAPPAVPPPPAPPALRYADCTTALDQPWIVGPRPVVAPPPDPGPHVIVEPSAVAPYPEELDVPPPIDRQRLLVQTLRDGSAPDNPNPWFAPEEIRGAMDRFSRDHHRAWVQLAELSGHPVARRGGTARVRAAFASVYETFEDCYAQTRPKPTDPDLRVRVTYDLAPDRTIARPVITGATGAFAACLAKALPVPVEDRGPIGATLVFHPTPPPDSDRASLYQRQLFGDASGGFATGRTSFLRAKEAEIGRCLAADHVDSGALLVDGTFDATGRLTTAAVHAAAGVPPHARACIASAVVGAPRGSAADRPLRCSLAFGVPAAADVPTIRVTPTAIALDGKPVADAPDALWLDGLLASATARGLAIARDVPVQLHLPYALVVDDAVPMRTVARVMSSILLAGQDFVFARSPADVPLPAPVPLGSGAPWHHVAPLHRGGLVAEGQERVALAVHVSPRGYFVGVSRAHDARTVPAAQLGALLRARRQAAGFADRTDADLAATPDTTYGQFRAAVEALEAAGFTDWRLVDAAELPVAPDE